jgi:hypothetical protein
MGFHFVLDDALRMANDEVPDSTLLALHDDILIVGEPEHVRGCAYQAEPTQTRAFFDWPHFFLGPTSVGGCQLTKERLLYSSDIRRSQFKVRVNKLDRSQ